MLHYIVLIVAALIITFVKRIDYRDYTMMSVKIGRAALWTTLLSLSCLRFAAAGERSSNLTIEIPSPSAESFAYDPARARFLLGSRGALSALALNGSLADFLRDEDWKGGFVGGVAVDEKRNRVVVVVRDAALELGRFCGVAAYDLDSKERLFFARLDDVGVGEGEKSSAHDAALDPKSGDVYITNPIGNFLWKVSNTGAPSVFLPLANSTDSPAAIVYDSLHKHLLVAHPTSGSLSRVKTADKSVHKVLMEAPLPGADAMALREDGTLVVASRKNIWLVGSASGWMAANAVDMVPSAGATRAVAMMKRRTFVLEEAAVREIEFPAEHFDNDPAWLVVLLVVVVVAFSLWRFQVAYFYREYRRKRA